MTTPFVQRWIHVLWLPAIVGILWPGHVASNVALLFGASWMAAASGSELGSGSGATGSASRRDALIFLAVGVVLWFTAVFQLWQGFQ